MTRTQARRLGFVLVRQPRNPRQCWWVAAGDPEMAARGYFVPQPAVGPRFRSIKLALVWLEEYLLK